MRKITITASDGEKITGLLPESWQEVPLSKYTALALASGLAARIAALADLCQLPPGILEEDARLTATIVDAAPWLLHGPLPDVSATPEAPFTHAGVTYVPAPAHLEKVNGEQMEALLDYLNHYHNNPVACAPQLLSVLYKPQAKKPLLGQRPETVLTVDVVAATANAFATLPMSTAWPLLQAFLTRSTPTARLIQKSLLAARVTEMMLDALETRLRSSARLGFCWNTARWLALRWTRRARKMLATSSPRSAFTALRRSSNNSTPLPPAGHEHA